MVKRYSHHPDPFVWLDQIQNERQSADVDQFRTAITLFKDSTSPQLIKGISIADILRDMELDSETLCAALLFPGYKNNEITLAEVNDRLGESMTKLLTDLIQMESLFGIKSMRQRGAAQMENLRKMLLAMVTDVRAVLIILAERVWQLHDIKTSEESVKKHLAQETLEIFAPLANRLGVWQLKWEIEDLCLRYLEPEVYSTIAKSLATKRQEREVYIQNVMDMVSTLLKQAQVQDFKIHGRVKHIYSIYKKMTRKQASIDEIYDISALRVLVDSVNECYTVLSVLQNHWPQVLEEFDDYISQPKANGYRSIHTVLLGPDNRFVEVQIRTHQMHQESELGVAAHWQYKEGGTQSAHYESKIALLRQVMAWQKEISTEANEPQKLDLFADQVYVFTPMGDIVNLQQGSTPLDFAYHIHSEVGHRCRGAKIAGNIVPLTYQLQTGDRVEILTAKHANPSRDWLNPQSGYIKSARARAKAQHWFRMKDALQYVFAGRELLDKELKKANIHERPDLALLAAKFNYKHADDLLNAIGTGDVKVAQVIHFVKPPLREPIQLTPLPHAPQQTSSHIQILGVNNLLTQMAQCCKPLPGDNIIGYITRNRGISIHRQDCKNMPSAKDINQERIIEVNWGEELTGKYPVDLLLHVQDRTGMLRDITTLLAGEKINVLGLQTQKCLNPQEIEIYITVEIDSRDQLKKALLLLQHVPSVLNAKRRE
ncbi:MAG: bifunctional (p)ppGpp synthetase/guanosine-3',5'-bis(diphosphate) 3'-pyrophosphohydrolase [Gammaproteobacteria bacterium]|nr:bifunctional (p)ppGpp synthetase/guanosine-3',5'-bis(diphosphate) 3'-pyrophosphohydrolase [Gammaproteobacteria bacterium]